MNIDIDSSKLEILEKMAKDKNISVEELLKRYIDDAIKKYEANNSQPKTVKIFKRPV